MVSSNSVKYLNKDVSVHEDNSDQYESSKNEDDIAVKSEENSKTKPKKRFSIKGQRKDINIDEIVENVRIKLEKEYKHFKNTPKVKVKSTTQTLASLNYKQKPVKNVNKEVIYDKDSDDNDNEQERSEEEIAHEKISVTVKQKFNVDEPRDDEGEPSSKETVVEQPETTEIENLLHEIDMRKSNDSYEDYVTPEREETFESDETERSRITVTKNYSHRPQINKKDKQYVDKIKWKTKEKLTTPNYDYDGEIKAKTESLDYDEKETVHPNPPTEGAKTNSLEAFEINLPIDGVVRKIKKPIGTMIPTRQTYKMSSPDYYAKLPIVAEKYNFDEPIPERDREPENLKYFGNPPASINRKVKL